MSWFRRDDKTTALRNIYNNNLADVRQRLERMETVLRDVTGAVLVLGQQVEALRKSPDLVYHCIGAIERSHADAVHQMAEAARLAAAIKLATEDPLAARNLVSSAMEPQPPAFRQPDREPPTAQHEYPDLSAGFHDDQETDMIGPEE